MSANTVATEMYLAQAKVADPGNAKSISVDKSLATCDLVSDAAQTRTLPRPVKDGAVLFLHFKTDGGDITLTVTGGFDEVGNTTYTFSEAGQFLMLRSFYDGTNYYWRKISDHNIAGGGTLLTGAGAGITGGTGTVYKSSVERIGNLIRTSIYIDLTGLASSTTDLDIIGVSTTPAHIGQITTAQNGVIEAVRMTCLELPAGGADDIDLYAADEATGVFDAAISTLAETAVITSGGPWASGTTKGSTGAVAANQYLYLTGGEAGTAATYTAGKFLIELYGY